MTRSDIDRIRDARDHAVHATRIAAHVDEAGLRSDRVNRQSALFDILVIGEALHAVSPDVKGLAPDLPWRSVWNTRNRIVHDYWEISLAIVARLIRSELPSLIRDLDLLLSRLEPSP